MPPRISRPVRSVNPAGAVLAICSFVVAAVIAFSPLVAEAAGAPARQQEVGHNLVGVWQGTTIANCPGSLPSRCNAHQKVTMTLVEGAGSKLGGYYKCAYGNSNCYNMNETGKIVSANLTGSRLWLRVIMPDGTSCLFSGLVFSNDINGGYSCSKGGGAFERGSWRAKRQY